MPYDMSISSEVSLSRVLDQMIVDGTPTEIIVQFLDSHCQCVKEIFAHSIFVYDLYDVGVFHRFPDKGLEKYICCLPPIPMFFALIMCADLALELGLPQLKLEYVGMLSEHADAYAYLFSHIGIQSDRESTANGIDIVDYMVNDVLLPDNWKNLDLFLANSHLIPSIMSAKVFLNLPPDSQWILVQHICSQIRFSPIKHSFPYGKGGSPTSLTQSSQIFCHCLVSLMKQLLLQGDVFSFRYVYEVVMKEISVQMGFWLLGTVPDLIGKMIRDGSDFSEVVFQMNLLDTQFDTLNLFLCLYVHNQSNAYLSMKQNIDLMEFFNLPFEYDTFLAAMETKGI